MFPIEVSMTYTGSFAFWEFEPELQELKKIARINPKELSMKH
jgi:hypothetical protein